MPGSGATTSVWMATAHLEARPALASDAKVDICVVGAGIAGLTTAYLLAARGHSVLVMDDGMIASGEKRTCLMYMATDIKWLIIQV